MLLSAAGSAQAAELPQRLETRLDRSLTLRTAYVDAPARRSATFGGRDGLIAVALWCAADQWSGHAEAAEEKSDDVQVVV
jgi:hypothetical protein